MPQSLSNYIFGNSLISFQGSEGLSTDLTNVPYWLNVFARDAGHSYAASGIFGFLRDLADNPWRETNVTYTGTPVSYNWGNETFAESSVNTIMINPAYFLQENPPDTPYYGDTRSPLSATLDLISKTLDQSPSAKIVIYEGWADRAIGVPQTSAEVSQYHALNQGSYHQWYIDYVAALSSEFQSSDIQLIPVAQVLSGLLTETPLSSIPVENLYVDSALHGSETLYFLAGVISYTAMYGEAVAAGFQIPDQVDQLVRDNFPEVQSYISARLQAFSATSETTQNTLPMAYDDFVTTDINTYLRFDPRDNDTDPNGDQLAFVNVEAVQQPDNGELEFEVGMLTYTPNTGFTGTETVTYFITDGNDGTASAQITIQVGGGGDISDSNQIHRGGPALDTFTYLGLRSEYSIDYSISQIAVSKENRTDTMFDIERISFSDGTLGFDFSGNSGQMYRLYQAAFNRVPDPSGLGYWIDVFDSGANSLVEIAGHFMNSDEFASQYGHPNTVDDQAFLTLLYSNVLGRPPDQAGFEFWADQQEDGLSRQEMISYFSESEENVGVTAPAINDGIWYL